MGGGLHSLSDISLVSWRATNLPIMLAKACQVLCAGLAPSSHAHSRSCLYQCTRHCLVCFILEIPCACNTRPRVVGDEHYLLRIRVVLCELIAVKCVCHVCCLICLPHRLTENDIRRLTVVCQTNRICSCLFAGEIGTICLHPRLSDMCWSYL